MNTSRLSVGFEGIQLVQLGHQSSVTAPHFSRRFGWAGKRDGVTTSHLRDGSGNVVKRDRLTRKTSPGIQLHFRPDPRLPSQKRWKRLHLLFLSIWVRGGRASQPFSSLWGWLISPPGTPATCSRGPQAQRFLAGHSSRRDKCIGTRPFLSTCMPACVCGETHT